MYSEYGSGSRPVPYGFTFYRQIVWFFEAEKSLVVLGIATRCQQLLAKAAEQVIFFIEDLLIL